MRLRRRLQALLCSLLLAILICSAGFANTHPPCTGGGTHEFESHILVLNSEDTEGQVENVCTLCGYTYIEYLPATGHNFGNWEVVEEKPESGIRIERRECQGCRRGETRTVRIEQPPKEAGTDPDGEPGINQMDYVLSASIGGVWGCVGAAVWYNSLVLNWYKRESLKLLKKR